MEIAKNNILQGVVAEFHEIDRDEVILLAEKGEIVARITERKIPNIAEMYGNMAPAEKPLGEQVYDESTSNMTFNFDDLADIEIDLEPGIIMRKNVELAAEKEEKKERKEKEELLKSLKKTESDLDKLYGKKEEETKTKNIIHKSNEIDYENMTTLIIESNKINEKDGEFKLPKALSENLSKYFATEIVKFDILDNKDNSEEIDENVSILRTDKGISIKSEVLIKLKLEEGDIVRIIKETEDSYRCEVIRKESAEHNIWSFYCINSIRGQKRRFGII